MISVHAALTVVTPAVLWALLLAVPITLLHLYHRRLVVVPFLPLLVEAVGPRRPGGGWRRLRDRASLVLRLLALASLVLALAGLSPARAGPPPPALVLVVDADVTMRTVESDGRTRYLAALELARRIVVSDVWREVAVLEARALPEVLVAPTADRGAAAARLRRTREDAETGKRTPDTGRGDLDAALQTALSVAHDRAPATVRVLSARLVAVPPAADEESGGAVSVEPWGVGTTREDQGIASFELASAVGAARALLTVAVRNDADGTRDRELVVDVGESEVFRRRVDLGAGESTEPLAVEVQPPKDGGWLRVRLDGGDAYAENDGVDAWLAPPLRPSVLVVHAGNVRPYTRAILDAMGEGIDVAESGFVHVSDLARANPRDVTIVDGVALPEGALRPGAWLFLAPLGSGLPFEVAEPVQEPLVWRSAPDHPLVQDLDLGAAWVARGFPVSGAGLVSLAEADGATVLGEGEAGDVRYVVLGLDPEGSDLPLRAAFPLLLQAAVRRLAAVPIAPLAPFYRAGGALRPRLPLPGGQRATLTWPGGRGEATLDPGLAAWRVPPGARGEVEVRTRSWSGRTAFVDVDPERTIVPVREATPAPLAAAGRPDSALRWRRALLLAALLFLVLDLGLLAGRDRASRDGRKLDPSMVRA